VLKKYFPHEIKSFKRLARERANAAGIKVSVALDQIALGCGYRNWSLLVSRGVHTELAPWVLRRSGDDFSASIRAGSGARMEPDVLVDRFQGPSNAVDFAIQYMEGLLALPRYSVRYTSRAYKEMRAWLPYAVLAIDGNIGILVNRNYKPVGSTSSAYVEYARFTHLHVEVDQRRWSVLSSFEATGVFLYDDGCTPSGSRADAEAYLHRLRILRSLIER
jgi:hypothetical protein